MLQNELKPPAGSKHKRKVSGRGDGSGHGTYSGRGCKGQKSRSGGNVHPRFEGGQLPIIKRLPRQRGFTNIFRTEYTTVNLGRLDIFADKQEVTPELLVKAGLIKSTRVPVKILGHGDISKKLTIKASKFTQSAIKKIETAGGKAETL
ncbi:MAG: 50S ribosomal protein L15 [Chloroflexi bacterium]|jgi:large subunit ribosomal protein L15|nr:50S ribosomal protein L15 [Chloroflexota bacterium]MBT7290517.1 50S ribosomal protein L15 [Chloroflexota bacterium]